MFWFICIAIAVIIGIGVLIDTWLRLLEDEQGRQKAGLYGILGGLILIITMVVTYRFLLIR